MAARGTVAIYRRTIGASGESFWFADYTHDDDGSTETIRMQPSVGQNASEKQLHYHADVALRARMEGDYHPIVYHITR